jgi:hypothetical protein
MQLLPKDVPNFKTFAIAWNPLSNVDMIFYKSPEHFEKYYNHWIVQDMSRKT